jgi:hypothetical protein
MSKMTPRHSPEVRMSVVAMVSRFPRQLEDAVGGCPREERAMLRWK